MKTTLLTFVLFAFTYLAVQAQQSTTYIYVDTDETWMKFKVSYKTTSPNIPFIELSVSQAPDFWVELEILQKNPTHLIAKIARSEVKMKIIFQQDGLLISDENDRDPRLFTPIPVEVESK